MIDRIIKEINASIENGCYMTALIAALSLPDMCGKVEYPSEKSSKKRYQDWYEEWIGQYETHEESKMPYLDKDTIYDLRCSLVHEGEIKINDKRKLTKFKLVKGDSWMSGGSSLRSRDDKTRELTINILNIIWKLRRCAGIYYRENKAKFDANCGIKIDFDIEGWKS